LNVTIALIGWGEKPQLSPWPAVVFSKKAGAIYNSRKDARVSGALHNRIARPSEIHVRLDLKGFPARTTWTTRRHDAAKALFCRSGEGWDDAAHICSKPD
jgi:hypothetical protein